MSIALLFPGQGSQAVGMGRELAQACQAARDTFAEADEVLGFALSRLMGEGPEEELTLTKNAQPALLTHSVAAFRVLEARLGKVTCAAGHSLGEYSAHVAAGTLTFRDALEAVRLRGELMFRAGEERPGTMAAVLGLDDGDVEAVCGAVESGICVPANFNSPGQVVISGDRAGVAEGADRAKEAGARRAVPLNVSGAFHSPLMEPAVGGLREGLAGVSFADPAFPVVSNVTAAPVATGAEARDLLVRQITAPVRWAGSVVTMIELGAERFVELGPGNVLCALNRRNARGIPCEAIGEPSQADAFDA